MKSAAVLLLTLPLVPNPEPPGPHAPVHEALDASAAPVTSDRGGGHVHRSDVPCLTDEQRRRIQRELRRARFRRDVDTWIRRLLGLPVTSIPARPDLDPTREVEFRWPVKAVGAAALDPGHHGISNFVDAIPGDGNRFEFNCGNRTYDGHRGTDIFSWPYGWNRMATSEIEIIAAAPGRILWKADGHQDMSCSWNGTPWNAVYVEHLDGSIAWYGHLKRGSTTPKPVGAFVAVGETLGVMGSSGNSTGPHLHLEVYDAFGQLVDPFLGTCHVHAASPTWESQPTYFDSAINRIQIGDAAPVLPACPNLSTSNEVSTLSRGSVGYFTAFYRDQRLGQVSTHSLKRPNGTEYFGWTQASTVSHYAASWWWRSRTIAANEAVGTWTYEVTFEGVTYSKTFEVN